MDSNYSGPAYLAPAVVSGFNIFFHYPRNFHSDEIVDLLSPDNGHQKDYEYGLIFVGTLIAVFFFLWLSIIVMLKLRGDEVGCASGGSFHYTAYETIFVQHSNDQDRGASGSTDVYDDNDSSIATNSTGQNEREISENEDFEEEKIRHKRSYDSVEEIVRKRVIRTRKSKRREQRTRSVFIFAGLLSLGCNAALLVLVISPFNEVVNESNDLFLETQDLVNKIDSNIHTIAAAREDATRIVESETFNVVSFCPNITESQSLEGELAGLTEMVSEKYHEVDDSVQKRLGRINSTFVKVQDGMDRIQEALDTTSEYLWMGPAFIVLTSFTITFALFGVGMAMKGDMQRFHQVGITYLLLPLLIAVFVACCATAIAASASTMVTGDACVGHGSPDKAILAALEMRNYNESTDEYIFAKSYTGGCSTADPTEAILELRNTVESTIATIWYHMSNVDSVGRKELSQQCGRDVTTLVEGARDLANILTTVRKALDDTTATLKCDEIHPIYVKAVHDTLCTDVASGAAWTFIMFFSVSIFTAIMISLRAAWLQVKDDHEIKEEKEERRNMNEHAEYLDFVSKYKDEWQDYDGINEDQIRDGSGSWSGDGSEYAEDQEVEEEYDEEDPQIPEEVSIVSSVRTADISFPSLKVPESLSWKQKDNPLDLGAQSAPPRSINTTILPALIAIPPTYSPGRSVDSAEISLPNTQESPVVVQRKDESKDTRNSHGYKKAEILPTLHVPAKSSDQGHGDDIEVLLGVSPTSDPTDDLQMTWTSDTGAESSGPVLNNALNTVNPLNQELFDDEGLNSEQTASVHAYDLKPVYMGNETPGVRSVHDTNFQEGRDDDLQQESEQPAARPRTLVSARLAAILKRE